MKKIALLFQAVIVLIGIGAFAFLILEPQVEGRNAHATFFEIYFNDLFLAYAYLGSVPFFMALYQAIKVLGLYRKNMFYSQAAVKALRKIKYYVLTVMGFVFVGEILLLFEESDDRAGGVFMEVLISLICLAIAAAAVMVERRSRRNADVKLEGQMN